MSSVSGEALLRRKRHFFASLEQVTATLKTLGKLTGGLLYVWASGGSAEQLHPSSKTV